MIVKMIETSLEPNSHNGHDRPGGGTLLLRVRHLILCYSNGLLLSQESLKQLLYWVAFPEEIPEIGTIFTSTSIPKFLAQNSEKGSSILSRIFPKMGTFFC